MMFLKSFEFQIHFWGHVANPLLVALPALAQTALKSEAGGGGPEKENRDCWLTQCERQKDMYIFPSGVFLSAMSKPNDVVVLTNMEAECTSNKHCTYFIHSKQKRANV